MQGRNSKEQVQNEEQGTNPEVMCKLLDSPVHPILSHACEVWTGCTGGKGWQQVHRMFVRGILGVNKTTSTFAVSGEFGRYPREHLWWQQTLKYYHSYDILGGRMLWKPKEATNEFYRSTSVIW